MGAGVEVAGQRSNASFFSFDPPSIARLAPTSGPTAGGARITLTGSTLRARSVADKGAIADALRENIWPRFESGEITPLIHTTMPLAKAAGAHALMESSEHIGKIILTV